MNDAGRIGFVIRGDYADTDTYDFLDVVYYNDASYVAKKLTIGNKPQESNEYWQILARGAGENANTPNYWKMTSWNNKGTFNQSGTTWIVTVPTMSQPSDAATAYWGVKLSAETLYTIKFGIINGTSDDSAYVNVSDTAGAHYQFSKIGNGDAIETVRLPQNAWVWMKFQHYSNTDDAYAYIILEPVVMIDEQRPSFTQAKTRTNIANGNSMSVLFGKIMKWFADFKDVAFTGSYSDLSNKPTIPAAVAVKGNAESTYRTGNVNLTPANIGAIATTKVLTTKEQINANTDTSNVAGATAVKAMVSEINSKLVDGQITLTSESDIEFLSAKALKRNGIVSVHISLLKVPNNINYFQITTLPVGYRPKISLTIPIVGVPIGSTDVYLLRADFNSYGGIYITNYSGRIPQEVYIDATFIAS